ncbi:hypothetical protein [Bacteroides eggerthii]|jgi:hypothetical protein|uniref:hypothetical protein n=1 Tax=Bacteroides eggerthii TaxID=28111 RepID=UPI000E4AC4DC|nr:hypothetical protein [Bacteroides eggerthii]RHH20494.1 hypothetical protein DW218_16635 [Bacteroides eggerthii]
MGFTTPCFIRKNTPELRKKLEKLGYNHSTDVIEDERFCIATSPVNCNYHVILKEVFDDTNPHHTWNCAGRIDCGTNEELFIVIAALRDDTDNNQLFTNGRGDWGIYRDNFKEGGLSGMNFFGIPNDFDLSNYHKATVDELIEYFKEMEK